MTYQPVFHRMVEEIGPESFRVVCDCGRRSRWFEAPASGKSAPRGVAAWRRAHEEEVVAERHRDRGPGTLRTGLAHIKKMATDLAVPEDERALWEQLRMEHEHRLSTKATSEDVPLWPEDGSA